MFKWIGKKAKQAGGAVVRGAKWLKKHAKKVLPIALLGAAAFFTFGAALGVTAGWSTQVSSLVSNIGLSGKMASVVGGALTQAGSGALIGGGVGAATGQGLVSGATAGAAAGALTGGVSGALAGGGGAAAAGAESGFGAAPGAGQAAAPGPGFAAPAAGAAGQAVMQAPGGSAGIGQNIWNFVNSNVGAQLVKGVGGGLMAGAQQNAQHERSDEERERQAASMNVKHNPLGRIDFQQAGGRILARMSEG